MPNVPVAAVEGFAKVWRSPGGLTLMLDDVTKQFALDFARVTLRSFIIQMIQDQAAAAKKAAEKKTESSLIITG